MKKTLLCTAALATSALTLSAQESSDKGLSLYTSYSAGYLLDSEETLHTARVGLSTGCARFFVQAAFSESEESIFDNRLDTDFTAISLGAMANHYYDSRFSIYYGASAGIAEFDVDANVLNVSVSEDDTVFYVDVFAGFEWALTDHLSANVGARYLFADEPSFISGDDIGTFDDISVEAGLSLTF